MSFLIVPDSKVQNIIGFFAYMSVTLTDIVSAIVLGFTDKSMILTLVIGALTIAFLLCYGKLCLLGVKMPADPDTAENASSESDGEEEENNP